MSIGDHFYTISSSERNDAVALNGYVPEGTACFVFGEATMAIPGGTPFHRLYNVDNGNHFYTASMAERDGAIAGGYVSEGSACAVFSSGSVSGTIPLFRLFNPSNGNHFYTTDAVERDNAVVDGYTSEGTACFVYAFYSIGTAPLFRLFHAGHGDHFYTTNATERDAALADGYISEGTACFVPIPLKTGGEPPGTIPFYRLLEPSNGNNFYTTDTAERDRATAEGYHLIGIACFVPSTPSAGTTPLYRLFNPDNGDHFYTTSATERDAAVASGYTSEGTACSVYGWAVAGSVPLFRLNKVTDYLKRIRLHLKILTTPSIPTSTMLFSMRTVFNTAAIRVDLVSTENLILPGLTDLGVATAGWTFEGTACFVFASPGGGTVPLFRLFNPGNDDHFYTTDVAESNAAMASGYTSEGTACFVYASPAIDAVPLLRLFHPGTGDHFYTTDAIEHDDAVASGYATEGTACFVLAGPILGTTPLYRLFNPGSGDHFYTTSAPERDRSGTGCLKGKTSREQNVLFSFRDGVGARDITAYFIRSTVPPFNGCAAHPSGQPGAVITQSPTPWTLAHEIGHVLGLGHVNDNTRLMTEKGTDSLARTPPLLDSSEVVAMLFSPYTYDM